MIRMHIHCDDCDDPAFVSDATSATWNARREAEEHGWRCGDGGDFCPACKAERDDEVRQDRAIEYQQGMETHDDDD